MSYFEKFLVKLIIILFLFIILFYDFNSGRVYYDCDTLYKYDYVPSEVIQECIKDKMSKKIIST